MIVANKIAAAWEGPRLDRSFYEQEDVVALARALIGKVWHTHIQGAHVAGLITETEAYAGIHDRASHAWGGRHTTRNTSMYARGGTAYVFLCYGIHHLFNVVTNAQGVPHAILIRGIRPLIGMEHMRRRRGDTERFNTSGPGRAAQAMGITLLHDGTDLLGDRIWITDPRPHMPNEAIIAGPRIGVDYAGADALLPYRFLLAPDHQHPLP